MSAPDYILLHPDFQPFARLSPKEDVTMALCPPCQALEGQTADTDPHDGLRGQNHSLYGDGVRETYRCRCGAQLERFVASKAFGNQSGSWKFLTQT
jgi:hypothetical protein